MKSDLAPPRTLILCPPLQTSLNPEHQRKCGRNQQEIIKVTLEKRPAHMLP
jgi:hypothetical protein